MHRHCPRRVPIQSSGIAVARTNTATRDRGRFLHYDVLVGGRTFAIGDIHGDLASLELLFSRLPAMTADDTVVFLGDYIDRGPDSAGVVAWVRALTAKGPAKVIALRGNHEDAWLQVIDKGWLEYILPRGNGCLESLRSFTHGAVPSD